MGGGPLLLLCACIAFPISKASCLAKVRTSNEDDHTRLLLPQLHTRTDDVASALTACRRSRRWLVRTRPLGPWAGQRVLDLGCGVGQLGIGLALAGAAVTLTDLPHIVPLTQTNVDLNAARCAIRPACQPYLWGAPVDGIAQAGAEQQQPQQPQHQRWDAIVAADVLYEPQWYDALLAALVQLCPAPPAGQPSVGQQQQEQQQQHSGSSQPSAGSPPAYLCYRLRKYREGSFEAKARAAGFEVSEVPVAELHPDYRCGGYRLVKLQRQPVAH